MFLLDTNILSEVSEGRKGNAGVVQWIAQAEEESLFLSVLTMGEIRKGLEKMSNLQRKAIIETFYDAMRVRFSGRILSLDLSTIERWGIIVGSAEAKGIKLPVIDSMIAAVALEHNLTLVTRNTRDFRFVSIPTVNPWQEIP